MAANLLSDEIKISASENKRRSHFIRKVVSGRITKKYRATRLIASMTNLDRKKLSLNNTKHLCTPLKKRPTNVMVQLASKVASFLSRDNNSRMTPGKKDGRGQIQNRVLINYMKNLHLKFLAENPEIKVSTGTFPKLRPSSIRLCNFLSKNTCPCTKHQNFALKCKRLQSYKVTTVINLDSFIRMHDDKAVTDMLTNTKEENIVYSQWKRVKVDIGGNVKEKTRPVQIEVPTEEFRGIFIDEITAFREHVEHITIQYKVMKDLKVQLLPTQCIIQMDFAKDFHCQNNDEVQNAYFGAGNVTIFPAVVYYRNAESAELLVKSIAFISDEGSHDSYAVHAI